MYQGENRDTHFNKILPDKNMSENLQLTKKINRNEIIKTEYNQVLQRREGQYDKDVEMNPDLENIRIALNVHNDIVLDYANGLCEMNPDLSPEDKVAITIATIFHDSGKLSSGLLDHHKKGVELADSFVGDLIGTEIEGIEITEEIKANALNAIERHMNHPFLVMLSKGERFQEPESIIDKTVYDADMLANIGFKNIAFRLANEEFLNQDLEKSKQNGTLLLEETFENVLNDKIGVRSLENIVLTKEAKKIARELMQSVEKIYEKMKNDKTLEKIQSEFAGAGNEFSYQAILSTLGKEGVGLLKKRLNEEIQNAGNFLEIPSNVVSKFIM